MSRPLDFFKSLGWLANVGHVLAGYGAILTVGLWSPGERSLNLAWAALLVYVGLKEYVLDLLFESGETVGSSTVDAIGYVVGALVASGELWARAAWP